MALAILASGVVGNKFSISAIIRSNSSASSRLMLKLLDIYRAGEGLLLFREKSVIVEDEEGPELQKETLGPLAGHQR
ncbi:MAG TPA: hypothetical protein VF779_19715 [Pyrinomonadaceae bacterium]